MLVAARGGAFVALLASGVTATFESGMVLAPSRTQLLDVNAGRQRR